MDNKTIGMGVKTGFSIVYAAIASSNFTILIVLGLLMFLDIIIGVGFALIEGDFASYDMKKGLLLKMLVVLMLLALTLFQIVLSDLGLSLPFVNFIGASLCFMEMFSILESFAEHGIRLPEFIMKWFRDTNDRLENSADNPFDVNNSEEE